MGDETIDMFRQDRRQSLGLKKGRALRDEGIRRAVDHAEAVEPSWSERVIAAARPWIAAREEPFFIHEMREALVAAGVPEPPELRAWGGIPRRLVKLGLIRFAGVHYSDKPDQHMAHKSKWVRA